jgi:hypothetical protein
VEHLQRVPDARGQHRRRAARGRTRASTHYRLLFLCGLVLFVMTFVINTTAEIVRQRFRKRNALL